MAIYHCSVANVSRAKGSSSCATLAYISGEKVRDERTGELYSYNRQERVVSVGTILPESAPAEYADSKVLFNAIEKHETADNARTAKKIQVALPRELGLDEQKNIVEDYIRHNITKEGYCATYAIHDGGKTGNYHAHILVANRPLNAKGEWGCKRKMAYALDEAGERIPLLDKDGQQKTDSHGRKQWKRINVEQNPLDTREFLKQLRQEWAVEVNKHLEPSQQIDHRSNADRGIDDKPTIHEGYAARAIEAQGGISERCQVNREIRAENLYRQEIRAEIAVAIAKDKELEKKERELHERLRRVDRRRKNDEPAGRTPAREQQAQIRADSNRTATANDKTTGTRDYTAELIAHRREATEREIARISKEREEAARRKHEAEARKQQLAAEREKAAGADRGRDDYTLTR